MFNNCKHCIIFTHPTSQSFDFSEERDYHLLKLNNKEFCFMKGIVFSDSYDVISALRGIKIPDAPKHDCVIIKSS